jgi:carboxymethylenebutenolidase
MVPGLVNHGVAILLPLGRGRFSGDRTIASATLAALAMHDLQNYMVYEYVADYKAGRLSRRDLVRRVLNITGGLGTTATLLLGLGCSPQPSAPTPAPQSAPAQASPPAPSQASPSALPQGSPSAATARSPLSVAPNDPTVNAQDITFAGSDGAMIMAYQARPKTASGPLPLVLVCHENRGLTEHIRDVVRRFTREGFLACGVDLVSRQGGTASITDPNQFSALLTGQNVNPDQFVNDFAAAIGYYKSKPDLVNFDKIGMNGYCFGGGVVWRSTEQIPELKAVAPFYGAFPPPEKWSTIKAAVLGVYSSDPNDFANNRRDELDQALTAAGVPHTFNVYPNTRHAFHNDTGSAYNEEQAIAAWRDTIAWFKHYLA